MFLDNIRIMSQADEFYIIFNVLENIYSFYFLHFYYISVNNIVFPAVQVICFLREKR
jgi:hypothetical protein